MVKMRAGPTMVEVTMYDETRPLESVVSVATVWVTVPLAAAEPVMEAIAMLLVQVESLLLSFCSSQEEESWARAGAAMAPRRKRLLINCILKVLMWCFWFGWYGGVEY